MIRIARIVGPALLVLVGFATLLVALVFAGDLSGGAVGESSLAVRLGLPIAKFFVTVAEAGTIGALALVVFALSPKEREFNRALDIAAGAAAVWAVSAAITGFFVFLDVTQTPLVGGSDFGAKLAFFFGQIELGQAWFITILIAAVVTVLCFAVRNHSALFFVAILAVIGLIPLALQGHAAGTTGHDAAITGIALHTIGACVWLGGLLTLAILSPVMGARVTAVVERYSTLALVAALVVLASGYVSAQLRVGNIENLFGTTYGILVLVKVLALGALACFGLIQRRWIIAGLKNSPTASRQARLFWVLIVAEFAFMGVAIGTATALARTASPVEATVPTNPTPAEFLTGEPLPPPVSALNYLTMWNFDLLWIIVCAFAAFFYLAGVWRLRRRGDAWPVYRTVLWLSGVFVLFWITNGGVNVYEKYLFSAHMLGHMVQGMVVPLLLVVGAPITLALRTIRPRHDGSRGGREWIMLIVHSRAMAVLTNPIVAAALFTASLWAFYYTDLFRWATEDHIGHTWMIVHFSVTGYLFVQSLIGIDPVPYRAPYPLRLLILLATMAFHAFFGIALMTGTGLLLADWYGAMGRPWLPDALADQQTGGGIAWSVGEIPTVILAIVVAMLWSRSDGRDAKRLDRKADRTNDAELEEYNRMLAGLAEHDK